MQATGPRLDDAAIEGEGRLAEGAASLSIGRGRPHEVGWGDKVAPTTSSFLCGSLSAPRGGAWRELGGFGAEFSEPQQEFT